MNFNLISDTQLGSPFSIIHLDKLYTTLKCPPSSKFHDVRDPDKVVEAQKHGSIELRINRNSVGSNAYYHCFDVFLNGGKVGKLLTGSKMNTGMVEFDMDNHTFYAENATWWYDIHKIVEQELGLICNNIKQVEIAMDTTANMIHMYGDYYRNSTNYPHEQHPRYLQSPNIKTDIIENGTSYNVRGVNNLISIYHKSSYAKEHITDFYTANGLGDIDIYRVECRLKWNYLKSLISRKHFIIDLETLKNVETLMALFVESVKTKLTFKDLQTKRFDNQRNKKHDKIFILRDYCSQVKVLPTYPVTKQSHHYKTNNSEEKSMHLLYIEYLESGKEYLLPIISSLINGMKLNNAQVVQMINKLNKTYNGDRTDDILERMDSMNSRYPTPEKPNVEESIALFICKTMNKLESQAKPKPFIFPENYMNQLGYTLAPVTC